MFSASLDQRILQDYLLVWIEAFLIDRKAQNVSRGTLVFYQRKLSLFSKYCEGQQVKSISQITPTLLRDFLLQLSEHHSAGGVHAVYRSIRTFLRWYWDEDEPQGKNPIEKVKAPHNPIAPQQGVTRDEFDALLAVCCSERDKALLMVLMDTGIRAEELCGIRLEHVGFDSILIEQGKGRKPRTVFLGRQARKQLRKYLKEWGTKTYLFTNDEGDRLCYPALRQIFRRLCQRAGLSGITPHDLRRGYAIESLRRGVDLLTLSRLLGHSSLTLLPRYANQTSLDLAASYKSILD